MDSLSNQSGVRLIEVFNNRNWPNTIYFSVRVRLIEVYAELFLLLDVPGCSRMFHAPGFIDTPPRLRSCF